MQKEAAKPHWQMQDFNNVKKYAQMDNLTALEKIEKQLKIEIMREDERELEFDTIGFHCSIVNAFRRILICEVPSMAIEHVYIINNTSILQDEVLASRLGLVPLRADARLFEYPPKNRKANNEIDDEDTLRYELKITCTKNPPPLNDTRPEKLYKNSKVLSRDIKWVPIGRQADMFPCGAEQFGVIDDDILITKLRPGHEIHAYMHAIKSTGRNHAKFSPICMASYRLMPSIKLLKPIRNADAHLLKSCFSPGVIEVVKKETSSGEVYEEAFVANSRYDSCSRNVLMYDQFRNCVELNRENDHYIFSIESIGALPPATLFIEAVKVLKNKCKTFLAELGEK